MGVCADAGGGGRDRGLGGMGWGPRGGVGWGGGVKVDIIAFIC